MKEKVLFMTACINPKGMSNTAVLNMELRKHQYLEAVYYYLKNTKYRILFVENSGVDISSFFLEEIKAGRMEILTFEGNDFDKNLGKGYGEGLIVKQALCQSKWMKDRNIIIIKVSGRHVVKNIKEIETVVSFGNVGKHFIACDINPKAKGANSDMFIATSDFFSIFEKYIGHINEKKGIWFEHVLYQAIIEYCKYSGKFIYLPMPLNQKGVSGSMGTVFKSPSSILVMKHLVKFIMYKLGLKRIC